VAQAADITVFKAGLVQVGEDQLPMIEQTNEIVRRVNRQAGCDLLVEVSALVPAVGRLPGVDGRAKLGKSAGNAIPRAATPEAISRAVKRMYTAPEHRRAADPGRIEGNVMFIYLDAFDKDHAAVEVLKAHHRRWASATPR
jgi:tryptophanyl-tRNA synthetase